ncbi:MAG: LysR family transcriptional regulator [Candidatus Heteroscillospira sp.]|jgi:DNA-binding transcriptional LysR family regulator
MATRYNVFLRVIETGSFTRAAESLGYSQSAVSQTVKALEQEFGTRLLSRGRDGISLTADGEAYLPYFRAAGEAENALEKKRREMQGLENSTIRIGTFTSVSRNLLPKLMQEFKSRYPGVQFELLQGEYSSISQWVRGGAVDFGFLNARFSTGLSVQPLYTDAMMAVLPPEHPLAKKSVLSLADLENESFILLDEGEHSVPIEAFRSRGLTPNIEYKVTDDYSILAMVKRGLGYSILYNMVLAGFCEGVAVRPIQERPERTIALAWRRWDTMPLASRRFAEFIPKRLPEILKGLEG